MFQNSNLISNNKGIFLNHKYLLTVKKEHKIIKLPNLFAITWYNNERMEHWNQIELSRIASPSLGGLEPVRLVRLHINKIEYA